MSNSTSPSVAYGPRRVGHVNFFVKDFYAEIEFLKTICGFTESGRESNVRSGFVTNGNTHHDIGFIDIPGWQAHATSKVVEGPADRGSRPSLNHFGFEMYNEVALVEAYKRALAHGMKPRITHNGTSKSNYIFDPWGNQYQLYADEILDWTVVFTGGESEFHANPPWNPLEGTPDPTTYWNPNPRIVRVEEAPLHPMLVTHAVMATEELPAFGAWLTDVLGLSRVAGDGERLGYYAGSHSYYDIVLVAAEGEVPVGMHHASFEVWPNDDLDVAAKRLVDLGVEGVERIDTKHKRAVQFRSPSDLVLEFYVRLGRPDVDGILATANWRHQA